MFELLQKLWSYSPEQCGLILNDNSIVPLRNIHPDPWHNFQIDPKELEEHRLNIQATWHTHPKTTANLSVEDYRLFQQLPAWYHYIVSRDEVRCYYVTDRVVYLYDHFVCGIPPTDVSERH